MEELLHMARCSRWEHDNSRMSRGRIFPNFFCWCGRTGEYYVRRRQWNIRHSEAEHGGRISGCKRLLRRLKGNGRVFWRHAYQRLIKLRVRGESLTATRWHVGNSGLSMSILSGLQTWFTAFGSFGWPGLTFHLPPRGSQAARISSF